MNLEDKKIKVKTKKIVKIVSEKQKGNCTEQLVNNN